MTKDSANAAQDAAGDFRAARLPRARIFLRSLLLQASWNFERLQNLGFLAAIAPALDVIWKDPKERRLAYLRHLEYFNTHPYMAGFCLGATARMEETLAAAPEAARPALENRLHTVKSAIASACAALGDSFFWGALRPACAVLSILIWGLCAFALWGGALSRGEYPAPLPGWVFLTGVAAYLLLFNALALRARWVGLERGYRMGDDVAKELKRLPFRVWNNRIRLASFTLVALIGAVGAALLLARRQWLLLAVAAGYMLLKRLRFSNAALYSSTLIAACVLAWIR